MFQEPQILPWLARKAGVPFPEARAIWQDIASKSNGESSDVAWRQIRDLRRQLVQRGRDTQQERMGYHPSELDWMFPLPLFQTWAQIQARIVLSTWRAWAKPARSAKGWSSLPPAVGS
jgi:hypothetical protein